MDKQILNVGELFVGAGGLGVGFILADHPSIEFAPIFSIDNDNSALETYQVNLKWLAEAAKRPNLLLTKVLSDDVEKLSVDRLTELLGPQHAELDLLVGGPPCQGFSSSNRTKKKESKSNRNRLTGVFMDRVANFMPKMFLLENVQGVQWTKPTDDMLAGTTQQACLPNFLEEADEETTNNLAHIGLTSVQQYVINRARALGYRVWYTIEDSANYGVPQHRNRFLLFGVRSELVAETVAVDLAPYLYAQREQIQVTVGQAIGDLPLLNNGDDYQPSHHGEYHPSASAYVQYLRRYMSNGDLHDHFTTKHNDEVLRRYEKIKPGQNWEAIRDLMTNYDNVDNTHSNIYRRLRADMPANTITHYRKSMIIHPSQHRGLSFREACRLQSFPDWYRFSGGREEMQQQLANAVPPRLASKVAYAIAQFWIDHILKSTQD